MKNNPPGGFPFWFFLGICLVYFFHITPSVDLARSLPQVLAILDHGRLSINDYLTGYRAYPDLSIFEGKVYPGIAPGLTFLTVPIYAALRFVFELLGQDLFPGLPHQEESLLVVPITFFLAALPTVLTALMLFRFGLENGLSRRRAYFIALLFGIGSPAFSYAVVYNFAYHNLSNFLALYAFLEIMRRRPHRPVYSFALVGLCLGMLPLLWHPAGLTSIILMAVFLFWEPKGAVRIALPSFLIPLAVLLIYQWAAFGHPLSLPYQNRMDPTTVVITSGFMGSGLPSLEVARKLLVGLHRPLLLSVPFAAVAIWSARGFVFSGKKPPNSLWVSWVIFGVYFLWNSTRTVYWEGAVGIFGPRYLMSALPFLFVMLVYVLPRVPTGWAVLIGAYSVLVNLAGAHYRQPFDIDSIILFVLKGPSFPLVNWLNAIPVEARGRFPDLFPASQWAFMFAFLVLMSAYVGIAALLFPGERDEGRETGPPEKIRSGAGSEALPFR